MARDLLAESAPATTAGQQKRGPKKLGFGQRGLSRRVFDHFVTMGGAYMTPIQVSRALGVTDRQKATVAQLVARLAHNGQIEKDLSGRYRYGEMIQPPLFPEVIFDQRRTKR